MEIKCKERQFLNSFGIIDISLGVYIKSVDTQDDELQYTLTNQMKDAYEFSSYVVDSPTGETPNQAFTRKVLRNTKGRLIKIHHVLLMEEEL